MIFQNTIKHFVSSRQYEFTIAWGLIGQAFTLFSFETFAMVFCDKFGIVGNVALLIYVGLPIVGLIGTIVIGNLMIRTGYQDQYLKTGSNVNSEWTEIIDYIRWERNRK